MLLFFLTLFSNYDLFNCDQEGRPNFNNTPLTDLIHKSIREIDALLKNFQQEIKKEKLALRTLDVENENLKEDLGLFNYSLTPYSSRGISWNAAAGRNATDKTILRTPVFYDPSTFYRSLGLDNFPSSKLPLFSPQAPFLSPGVTFTTFDSHDDTLKPKIGLRSPDETSPPTTKLGPSMPVSLMKDTTLPSPIDNTTVPFVLVHQFLRGSTDKPIKFSKISTILRATKRKVGKARTNDTPVLRMQENRITLKPRSLARTLSKAQAWVSDKRWKKIPTLGNSTSARNSKIPRQMIAMPRMIKSTHTARTANLLHLHEDNKGVLYVLLRSSGYATDWTGSTVPGDVLFGADKFITKEETNAADPNQRFHDIMNATDEGCVIVFISELARLVALKEPRHVQEVVSHSEIIINRYMENNKLGFAGRQIETAAIYISRMMSEASFDVSDLRNNALYLQLMLKDRRTSLSSEVNGLIDNADMLFDDKRCGPLFDALRDFEDYPNTNNKGWQICDNLIHNFIEPFRDISKTERGQILLNNLNKALDDRFGLENVAYRKWMEDPMIMTTTHGGGVTPKLDLIPLKKRIRMKRIPEVNRTTNQKVNENGRRRYYDYQTWVPRLRSLLPITRRLKRFKVIKPRPLYSNVDLNIVRPTQEYRRRRSRPTHPPDDMLQLFPQVPVEKKRTPRSPPPIVAASVEKHSEQARAYTNSTTRGKTKNNDTGVKLALANVSELSNIEYSGHTNNFNNVHKRIRRAIDENKTTRVETVTDFIQEAVNILNTYKDTTFKVFFRILDNEIRRYHYKHCKFSELMQNPDTRSWLDGTLKIIRKKSVSFMKANINEKVEQMRDKTYDNDVTELLDYVNSLYRDTEPKLHRVLKELKNYRKTKSLRTRKKIIQRGVRDILFDHYTALDSNTRRELKERIEKFWKQFKKNHTPRAEVSDSLKVFKNISHKVKELQTYFKYYLTHLKNKSEKSDTKQNISDSESVLKVKSKAKLRSSKDEDKQQQHGKPEKSKSKSKHAKTQMVAEYNAVIDVQLANTQLLKSLGIFKSVPDKQHDF